MTALDLRSHPPTTYVLGAVVVLLNAYDALISRELMTRGGSEANPLMAPIIGTAWFWVVKIGVPIAAVLIYLLFGTTARAYKTFLFLVGVFLFVCTWNTSLLFWRYPS